MNKALLRAAPALECAVRFHLSPEPVAPTELNEYRSSVLSVHGQLKEAAWIVEEFSSELSEPEPELLRQIKATRPGVFSRIASGTSSARSRRAAHPGDADRPAAPSSTAARSSRQR
ncbi:hypothetical protein STTU_5163 [Streptomyces sp. Tu6071]|uniref:hypothetical protein n=1 Tax=Streptomyces sp. Tu6071 TaxID=355249 RepID=UPI00020E5F5A|nr:hypothetical protein [Streptomyces sp. Tu6071]EGJ77952.1 hypothetical protein STTU_5163 [Streptomyces sp. Tu6071]